MAMVVTRRGGYSRSMTTDRHPLAMTARDLGRSGGQAPALFSLAGPRPTAVLMPTSNLAYEAGGHFEVLDVICIQPRVRLMLSVTLLLPTLGLIHQVLPVPVPPSHRYPP